MARATTKQQLIEQSEQNFNKLLALINSITPEEQEKTFSFEDRDKNIRDVLVHLYEWHQLLLKWANRNMAGEKINFLPEPYNWKTYPLMNVEFWKKHQNTTYQDAFSIFRQSHHDVMQMINLFSDEQLFTKKFFEWTGTTSLGSYCVSATASHYDWAIKKISKHTKELKGK
jgi:hypothetical protein